MERLKTLIGILSERLGQVAAANAVVGKPITAGDRHVVPLCELTLTFAGGGGTGEGEAEAGGGKGMGALAGGGAKATPVAVLVVEGTDVRLEPVER